LWNYDEEWKKVRTSSFLPRGLATLAKDESMDESMTDNSGSTLLHLASTSPTRFLLSPKAQR
jgi:hypothetical protein